MIFNLLLNVFDSPCKHKGHFDLSLNEVDEQNNQGNTDSNEI